jgi:phosphatidylglycerol:prolipoprotein diacylglycerol transferase
MIWEGGMSFHGALLLGALTLAWMARRLKVEFLVITDAAVVNLPLALGLVRIANFINAELVGRITDQSWGVQFPAYGPLLRHPSQLYEAFLEGLVLFAIMRYSANRKLPKGYLSAIFTSSYAVMRLLVESYYREPTYDLTYFASTGQILCSLMLIVGILMGVYCWKEYSQR